DIGTRSHELVRKLGGQPEAGGGVLTVHDGELRVQLLLERRQDRLDSLAAGMSHHVGDEQDPELVPGHLASRLRRALASRRSSSSGKGAGSGAGIGSSRCRGRTWVCRCGIVLPWISRLIFIGLK